MKYQPEIYFAGWRHNFPDNYDETMYRRQNKKNRYETEEIFRGWRRNFYVRERSEWEEEITSKHIPYKDQINANGATTPQPKN